MENKVSTKERSRKYLNPYIGGVLLGLVLLSAFFFAGEGLGASGAVKNGVSACVVAIAPSAADSPYFGKTVKGMEEDPAKKWILFQAFGVLVGGFLSGVFSRRLKFKVEHNPRISSRKRLILALIGGVFFGIGSQFGRGCTSGAALSGMASLSVAGFLTMIFIFGTGYALAYFFRKNWI